MAPEKHDHDLARLEQLREVEHWRRLVAARLDLAVAAVTAIDEPGGEVAAVHELAPEGLRRLLGLPDGPAALPETTMLLHLRPLLDELEAAAAALRAAPLTQACSGPALAVSGQSPVSASAKRR